MANEKYILVRQFVEGSNIEGDFVYSLHEYGLVTFKKVENELFIEEGDISEIEKMFRLHHDLGINYEGLDAIKQMLQRMQHLEHEMDLLQKRLGLYE